MFYRDFEKQTLKHDLLLPCYTASRELNTVGGMVANNSAGEKTLKYGQTKDFVKRIRVVLSDGNEYTMKPLTKAELDKKMDQDDFEGNIYKKMFKLCDDNYEAIKAAKPKTHKNSSGYLLWEVWDRETGIFDLSKIIVGSQGTLGIVTEAEMRLVHPTKHSNLVVVFLYDMKNLGKIVNDFLFPTRKF
jgi:FAD/FMN-containing dehydrogenase